MVPKEGNGLKKKGVFYRLGDGIYRGLAWCEKTYVLYGGMMLTGAALDFRYDGVWVEDAGEWIFFAGLGAATGKFFKYLGERKKKKEDTEEREELREQLDLATTQREELRESLNESIDGLREQIRRYENKLARKERVQNNLMKRYDSMREDLRSEYEKKAENMRKEYDARRDKAVQDAMKRAAKDMDRRLDQYTDRLEEVTRESASGIRKLSRIIDNVEKDKRKLEGELDTAYSEIERLKRELEGLDQPGNDI